ncbi:SHIRT domain-containing protein [Actinotignum sp. SLA_B059]|uniref:SHIRT domain-containing protein n=1 Tax=Actinotignum sp. SLA_B059 TaxID=3083287 RepID=UPI002A827E47|nr:SHIRT domain-containing protein [Actinotignum sp. SLA_B059]MDY5126929.1 SHIRT domain-containing protein [Actinotignum sp. SLA_B059]
MGKKTVAVVAAALLGFSTNALISPAFAATTVGTEQELRSAITAGQSVSLSADITLTGEIEIPSNADLSVEGQGHTITAGAPSAAPGGNDHYNMFRTAGGQVTFSDVTLDGAGKRRGLWLGAGSTATLDKVAIKNGTTAGTRNFEGGAVYVLDAALNVTNDSVIENNSSIWSQATYDMRVADETKRNPAFGNLPAETQGAQISQMPNGGAIYATGARSTVNISDSTLRTNQAKDHSQDSARVRGNEGNGGAIYMDGAATLVAERASFIDNHVARVATGGYQGGAIYAGDRTTARITGSTVNVGAPFNTGGFLRAFNAKVTVDNSDFTFTGRGDAYGISGGAFASQDSALKINNSRFVASDSSKVTFAGGFIDIVGTGSFELTNSQLTGRGSGNGKGLATFGGAIAFETGSSATAVIQNSTIRDVHADSNGGAISLSTRIGEESAVNLRVVDSTISNAGTLVWGPATQVGGALFVGPGNTVALEGATLSSGRSGRGGLIYNEGSTTITGGTGPSKLSGGFVYSAVGAGIFNDGYLKLDDMSLGGNKKGDWSVHQDHPSSIEVDGARIGEYPGLNVYANKDVIITPKARLDTGDVRVIDGQSAVLLTGKLTNQLNISLSENVKNASEAPYAGQNEPTQRYIGYTVAKGADGYVPGADDANMVHYVTRDNRQAAAEFGDHTGAGSWDYVLSDEGTVVLGQRATMWYHPNEGHFDAQAQNVEAEQPYTIYSSTKLLQEHPAARPAQMTRYEGANPVREETRTITDSLGRTAELGTYTFVGWYCSAVTPAEIASGQANNKGYDFAHAFTDGVSANSVADAKGNKNPCTAASRVIGAETARAEPAPSQPAAPITQIVDPNELTAYAGYAPAYGVTSTFVSGTAGKELPEGVKKQPPAIDTKNGAGYTEGDTVASAVPDFTAVPDGNGQWTFQSWDATTKKVTGADQEFIGTWVWHQQLFKVTHEFQAADGAKKALPEALAARTPADNLGENGQGFPKGTLVTPTDTFDKARYSDAPGEVWSFTGWDRASDTITDADVHFLGYWSLTRYPQPAVMGAYGEWQDEEVTCEKNTVTQTRMKTTYTVTWNATTLEWDTVPTTETENQEREKTPEEVKACTPEPTKDPTFTEWIDGEKFCESHQVAQSRTKTAYTYTWNAAALSWEETATSSTETQSRPMTAAEIKECAVEPDPAPEPGPQPPAPAPQPEPGPAPQPDPGPGPEPDPQPDPQPEPSKQPAPRPDPHPSVTPSAPGRPSPEPTREPSLIPTPVPTSGQPAQPAPTPDQTPTPPAGRSQRLVHTGSGTGGAIGVAFLSMLLGAGAMVYRRGERR